MNKELFFLVGAGRSGTTALTKILDTAANVVVTMEAPGKMCIAARAKYNNTLSYPQEYIRKNVEKKIKTYAEDVSIYGDKNPNYVFFIRQLYREFRCKFVFIVRDGRDTVRSAMDFDAFRTPGYNRYEDDINVALTEPEDDFWDYARLRPLPHEPEFKYWKMYSKFEKYCWLWANFNKLLINESETIPKENFLYLNMTKASVQRLKEVFDFLGLAPFEKTKIESMLSAKINSLKHVTSAFPNWREWDEDKLSTFRKHADPIMEKLGFLPDSYLK